jgi:tetratricopeptide (TPR) repeat protein
MSNDPEQEYFKQAIKFDPNFSRAHAAIGLAYQRSINLGWASNMGSTPGTSGLLSRNYLEVALKNPSPEAYALAAEKEIKKRNFDKAIGFAKKGYELAPNSVNMIYSLAAKYAMTGRSERSIELLNRALRLDPLDTQQIRPVCYVGIGINYFIMGNLTESTTYLEKGLSLNPELNMFACLLAAAHAHLGNEAEGKEALSDYLKFFPAGFPQTIRFLYQGGPFQDSKVFDRLAQGLVKVGLPGDSRNYYKLREENRLSGEEIKKLFFGKSSSGFVFGIKPWQWVLHITETGEVDYRFGGNTYTGKAWMEGENFCLLREGYHGG